MIRVSSVRDYFSRSASQTIKMLLAGPPGAGKTLFCSTFPDVLYADMEGRLLSVRNRPVHRTPVMTLKDIEDLLHVLSQEPTVRRDALGGVTVRTVVLDTVDELARIIQKERLKNEKREALSMQDWGWYGDQMRNILRAYRNLPDLNVIFTVHLRSTEDSETGRVEYKPSIQGQVGDEVAAYVDEAFLLRARPTVDANGDRVLVRFLQCFPDPQYSWIKDHSGTMPPELPVDFATDFERLSALIFGELNETTPEPPPKIEVVAPPEEPEPETVPPNGKAVPTSPPLRDETPNHAVAPPVVDVPLPTDETDSAPAENTVATLTEEPEAKPAKAPVRKKRTETAEASAPAGSKGRVCAECGEEIDNVDIADLADILYGVDLCHRDFAARQKKK